MTIDLTGPVPTVVHSCDRCGRCPSETLYRLLGSANALCRQCFSRRHG